MALPCDEIAVLKGKTINDVTQMGDLGYSRGFTIEATDGTAVSVTPYVTSPNSAMLHAEVKKTEPERREATVVKCVGTRVLEISNMGNGYYEMKIFINRRGRLCLVATPLISEEEFNKLRCVT